jgi:hypothetical protein
MMLTDLANVLRGAGLPVVEVGGWQSRSNDGNRFAAVQGILCHWTGTALSAQGSYPSLNIVTYGRSDLPGMLSQLGLGRDGVWYVIGAGVAWRAGAVDQVSSDNYHAIGIEAEYHPDQGAWPDVQQRSYEHGCAALARHYGVPLDRIRGHYEAAVPYGRKPDPHTLPGGMPGFRQRVSAILNGEDDLSAAAEEQIRQIYASMEKMALQRGVDIGDAFVSMFDSLKPVAVETGPKGADGKVPTLMVRPNEAAANVYARTFFGSNYGFGEAIVKRLAEATGGTIDIDEEALAQRINGTIAPVVAQAVVEVALPAIREVMGEDNKDQAQAVIDLIRQKLGGAA